MTRARSHEYTAQLENSSTFRSQLAPLDLVETKGYIERRLQLAGATSNVSTLFPSQTIAAVHRHSRGIPRLINTDCENALIAAYAKQLRSVTAEVIEEVAAELRLGVTQEPPPEKVTSLDDLDVRKAARTLLELYAYLQKPPSSVQ